MPERRLDAVGFARLAEELFAADTPAHTAEQVVSYAVRKLAVDHAGVTLIRAKKRLETVAPTDPLVNQIDLLQYTLDEGPCRDAAWTQRTLTSTDLANDCRWPTWAPKAAAMGIGSMMAVELSTAESRVGALNLYYCEPRAFSEDDVAFADLFARHAAIAISTAVKGANLTTALDARKLIGQAQGILMERFGLDDERAFAVLRRYSQDHNVKLRIVAEQLVATRRLPELRSECGRLVMPDDQVSRDTEATGAERS